MKAAFYSRYGPPDVLQVREVEKPIPGNSDVLIKILAAVMTSSDSAFRRGKPFAARSFTGITRPKKNILGTELAGEIETVGQNVKRFRKGDRVFASTGDDFGAHAEYICLPEDGAMAIIPVNVTCAEAAAVCDGGLTALHFLRDKGKIHQGQKVLINGASGSVGTFAVQLAKYFGTEVTGVCSRSNVELVKSLGADYVIDYNTDDFTKNNNHYDIIFDTVGKSSFSRCKNALKQGGIYLTTVLNPVIFHQMLWTSTFGRKKAIISFAGLRSSGEKTKDLILLGKLVEAGRIKSVIDRRYTLEQITDAHKYVDKGHKIGSVIITLEHDL